MIDENKFMEIVLRVLNEVHIDGVGRIVTTRTEIEEMFKEKLKEENQKS